MSAKQSRSLRREREEEERDEKARMRRKQLIASGGCLILIGLIGFGLVRWLREPAATTVQGRLGGVQGISFLEGTQSNGGISPVCGCAHPHLHAWRGIEFAGRQMTLRHAGSPWTQWVVSSAEPDAVALAGGPEPMEATVVRLPADGRFDPLALVSQGGDVRAPLERKIHVQAEKFSIATPSTLHVGMPAAVPIGAWVPFPGSWVNLTATRSPFPESPRRPRLVEHYPRDVGFWPDRKGREHPREPQIFPLGDFLGPNLVLWTDSPQARVVGTAFGRPAGRGVITAVVVSRSVFSTRIAVAPAPLDFAVTSEQFSLAEKEGFAEEVMSGSGKPGTVSLTVDQPLTEAEYSGLRQRVKLNPKSWSALPPNPQYEGLAAEAGFWREEHFPPLPEQAGFNVWGPLQSINLEQVYGDLTVDDENVDLSGGGDVQLNDVEAFRDPGGNQLISAPLETAARAADVQFEAHGTVSVNGAAQSTTQSQIEPVWGAVALLVTLVGGLIALFNGLRRVRDVQPPRRP